MTQRSPNKWLIAIAVALGALLEIIDTSIVNVALTEIQASLSATFSQMSWVVSSYAIANVIVLPLSAWLGVRFGKKRYFVFSLVGFTFASVLCGISTSLWMLTVARVLQGLFGGGLLAKSQAILFETFPKEEQAAAQGFFGAIVIAGPAIGPTLGGYIVTNIGWRWIFFINLPVGISAVVMCLAMLPADGPLAPRKPIDWSSILLLALGLGSFQTFLEEGQSEDWFDSTFITACAALAVVSLVLFVMRQLETKEPVVDVRILRYRSLAAGSLVSITLGMALYGVLFAVPIFASMVLHLTARDIGMLLLPGAIASAVMMPIASALVRRYDPRVLLAAGGFVLVGAAVWLGRLTTSTSASDLFWPLIVRAFGTILMFLPLSMASLGPIPKKDVGAATAFYNLTRQLGGSVGVAMLSTLIGSRTAFHRSVIVDHLSVTDPNVQARVAGLAAGLAAKGEDARAAKAEGLLLLDGAVRVQSSVLAFNDTFFVTAVVVLLAIPLVLLLGKPAKGVAVSADAH